ncbi:hypothetical protein CCAX7_54690 [Capsulimonas corticalis]|uniref:Phage capsid-like C-terminal domain-containing protein n=2 Tax=Capsulimonas corticalis TaxID=2219043 RepID=A0A402D5R7_9BACT|nr:hypothetical protein CCAX7_54690 [Capsulimonas corticalis]
MAARELLVKQVKDLFAKAEQTTEDLDAIEKANDEIKALDAEIVRLKSIEDIRKANAEREAEIATLGQRPELGNSAPTFAEKTGIVPVEFKLSRPENFLKITNDLEKAQTKAYRMGHFLLATLGNNAKSQAWCAKNGIELRSQSETDNAAGGFLVPAEFDNDLIVLREIYGVFRKYAKKSTMRSDTKMVPRRTGGLKAYWVTDGQGITESQKGWDMVTLIAKKLACLALYSSELNEDAIIDITNDLAGEIAYAFALTEDFAGFVGDATSAYGGITGVTNKFLGLSATVANIAGLYVASGAGYANNWDSITLKDFGKLKGLCPQYALQKDAAWYCSQAFYSDVMEALMLAAGGVTAMEVAMGRKELTFMGYPVRISQAMPQSSAQNQIPVFFGDLSLAALFGDRRETTIATSSEYRFANDQLAIKGTERVDIIVHDIGNADAVAANRKVGPLVAMITPNA